MRTKVSLLFAAATLMASAASVTINGPDYPRPGANYGLPCTTADPNCVLGDPLSFEAFSVTLTQPTATNPNFVAVINTNYPETIPGGSTLIPPHVFGSGIGPFSISDLLLVWKGVEYGLVLSPHINGGPVDGYVAGGLYKSPGNYQTSGDVMGVQSPNPSHPVWLAASANPSASQIGSGTVTAAQTGNGVTSGKYTITIQFSAPAGFLGDGDFLVDFTSWVCANGLVTGPGSFTTGGETGAIPEPGSLLLCIPALLFFGVRLARQRAHA
jgi:hypothetical protein